jgi:hypothetical protein
MLTILNKTAYLKIKKRIEKSLALNGIFGTIVSIFVKMINSFTLLFKKEESNKLVKVEDKEFDIRYGVDTGGKLDLIDMNIKSKNWVYGTMYQAIDSDNLKQTLRELNLEYQQFTFVDIGAGKGKAIMLASTFPFKKIIGVEFSEDLYIISKKNLLCFPKKESKCGSIEILCMDALEFDLPNVPLIICVNNPFVRQLMSEFVDKVEKSFQKNPRRIIIIYFNPLYADLWNGITHFKKKKLSQHLFIYDSVGETC